VFSHLVQSHIECILFLAPVKAQYKQCIIFSHSMHFNLVNNLQCVQWTFDLLELVHHVMQLWLKHQQINKFSLCQKSLLHNGQLQWMTVHTEDTKTLLAVAP
jgi:hypothetical protein